MPDSAPKVSVVIAAYRPGEAVRRVIDSLDAQTLPQGDFEVLFVDDGSGDGTYEQLQSFAATRPNMRVLTMENSGWPSRPRNVGVVEARGEYVLFMDHDDSLYTDGLRRACEYAEEQAADVVNLLEFNTARPYWSPLLKKNIPNALTDGGIEKMMPFVPHKLYRRRLLLDNSIRFPERPRAFWEDWYVNVGAYRHSKVVSVLADTPVYLRHIHGSNTSSSFSPSRPDYWERLDDVLHHVVTTLDGPDFRAARATAAARHIISRLLEPLGRMLTIGEPQAADMAFTEARWLLARYTSDDVFKLLSKTHRAQAFLLRADRRELMAEFYAADQRQRSATAVREIRWRDGVLVAEVECVWEPKGDEPIFTRVAGKVARLVSEELERAIPPQLLDVTGEVKKLRPNIRLINRRTFVGYEVPLKIESAGFEGEGGALRLLAKGTLSLGPGTLAFGDALSEDVWDAHVRTTWIGMSRAGMLAYTGGPLPMIDDYRYAVAYSNNSHGLSLDLAQQLRTFAIDASPRTGPAGPVTSFSAPLDNVAVCGRGELVVDCGMLRAVAAPAAEPSTQPDALDAGGDGYSKEHTFSARVVNDADGPRFEGHASLPPGVYSLQVDRSGTLHRTKRGLVVDEAGQVQFT